MGAEALLPLLNIILPFLFVYSSASIYRSIYPEDVIKRSLASIAEYRKAKAEASKSKRQLKKLRVLEPQYRAARSVLLRSTLVKTMLLMLGYIAGSLLLTSIMPGLASPYYVPGIIATTGQGVCVIPSLIVYFLAFLLFYIAMRDNFL